MKKIKWMRAVASALMSCALIFTGCAGADGGETSPTGGITTLTPSKVAWPETLSDTAGLAASLNTDSMSAGSVSMDGTVYASIQAALDACTGNGQDYTIELSAGKYEEVLYYNKAGNVRIQGKGTADRGQDVVIVDANNGNIKKNNGQRSILFYQGSGSLTLEGVTLFNNVAREAAPGGSNTQAECLQAKGAGNVAAYNCTFLSHQDTIQTVAKAWFYNCYIEGDVDFIWMEAGSKNALYEKCELVSVGDQTNKAYIAAPKSDVAPNVWKGLVVYNSKIKVNCKETTLCRNPWGNGGESTTMYNQVAYVDTTVDLSGTGKIVGFNLANKDAFYKSGTARNVIGWKLDEATRVNTGVTVMSDQVIPDSVKVKEFNGREAILNRLYNTNRNVYEKDYDAYWDVAALVTKYGWTVDADTSKSLLDGEVEVVTKTYDFTVENVDPSGCSKAGSWAYKDATYGLQSMAVGDSVTFPVTGNSIIGFQGYEKAEGTFEAVTEDGTVINGDILAVTTKGSISNFFIYKGDATNITLKVKTAGNVYLAKVSVKTWTDEEAKATAITITGDDETSLGNTVTLKHSITTSYNGSRAVTWSIASDTTGGASVSNGVVTPGPNAGTIRVRVASNLTNTVFAEKEITVLSAPATAQTSLFDFKTNNTSVTYWKDKECTASSGTQIGGSTGYIKGSASKVVCYVDASAGSAKLSTASGGDPYRGQFNKGTSVKIPVSAGSVLSVMCRKNSDVYKGVTVGGIVMTNHTITCTASQAGYIEIVCKSDATANAYLFGIKVTDVNIESGAAIAGESGYDNAVTVSEFTSDSTNQDPSTL